MRYGVETALRIKVLKDAQFHLSSVSHLLFDASIPQACVDSVISTSGGILGKMSRGCYSSNQALDTPCIGFFLSHSSSCAYVTNKCADVT